MAVVTDLVAEYEQGLIRVLVSYDTVTGANVENGIVITNLTPNTLRFWAANVRRRRRWTYEVPPSPRHPTTGSPIASTPPIGAGLFNVNTVSDEFSYGFDDLGA